MVGYSASMLSSDDANNLELVANCKNEILVFSNSTGEDNAAQWIKEPVHTRQDNHCQGEAHKQMKRTHYSGGSSSYGY